MAENLMTKVWALDFAAHTWGDLGGSNQPQRFSTSNVKFVALAIARRSLMNGACWASQATLAEDTGLSAKTVHRCINELADAGWVRLLSRRRDDGARSTNKVWLTLPAVILEADVVAGKPHRFLPGDGGDDVDMVSEPSDSVVKTPPQDDQGPGSQSPGAPDTTSGAFLKGDSKGESKGRDGRAKEWSQSDDLSAAVDVIWRAASDMGRKRSSKADILKALRSACGRGHALERVMRGLGAYLQSPDATKDEGIYQKGAHTMLASDRWESFLEDAQARGETQDPSLAAQQARAAVGTLEAPSAQMQRLWMDLFTKGGAWNPDRGPQPGRIGCRVSDAIQLEFGVTPAAAYTETDPLPLGEDSAAFD